MLLGGIRIIDFSHLIPGSYTSLRLLDLGAEIIKVEPLSGDPTREFGRNENEKGIVFDANNRNKKSIAINLKKEDGQKLAIELIKEADVVIESFRPDVMIRLGLSYDQVKREKEDVIYCSLSGYGQNGTMSKLGSHDLNYLSLSGVLSQLKDKKGKPILPSMTFADIIGGMAASERIIVSLLQRERTGKGEHIDLSLMDSIVSLVNINIFSAERLGEENVIAQLDGKLISYNIYKTKDHRYVSLAALEPKFWKNFCNAVGREDLIPAHLSEQSKENNAFNEIKALFLSRTIEEWSQFGVEVDCCLTPILNPGELNEHPYFYMKKSQSDKKGPYLGENTMDILLNLLNKPEEEIAYLKSEGVIL